MMIRWGLFYRYMNVKLKTFLELAYNEENLSYKWVSSQKLAQLLQEKYPKEFTDKIAGFFSQK